MHPDVNTNHFYRKLKSYNASRKSVCPPCQVFSINTNTMTCMYQRIGIKKTFICPIELLLSRMINAEIYIAGISEFEKHSVCFTEDAIARITSSYLPLDYEENSSKYCLDITEEYLQAKGKWKEFYEIFGVEISKNYYDSVQEQTQEDIERE